MGKNIIKITRLWNTVTWLRVSWLFDCIHVYNVWYIMQMYDIYNVQWVMYNIYILYIIYVLWVWGCRIRTLTGLFKPPFSGRSISKTTDPFIPPAKQKQKFKKFGNELTVWCGAIQNAKNIEYKLSNKYSYEQVLMCDLIERCGNWKMI